MKEISDEDAAVIRDVLKKDVEEAEKVNAEAKKRGWTGTGVIGYHIVRLQEIIERLKQEEDAPDIDEETAKILSIESELNSSTKD